MYSERGRQEREEKKLASESALQARLVRQNPLRRKLAPRRCLKWGVLIKHAHMCVCACE